jgi:glycosyltransferase involved in cell wall biosynthesis
VNGVEIVVPYYGPVGLLKAAVRSVLDQTDDRWRLTIVDDCYPDPAGREWLSSLRDDRIRYFRNESNLGINRNFQRCLELAELDVFTMMGCDDLLLPGYVRTVLEAFQRVPDVDLVQPVVTVIGADGRPTRSPVDLAKKWLYAPPAGEHVLHGEELAISLLRGNWLYFPALCWRTKAVQAIGFREGFDVVMDLKLVIDLVEQGGTLLVVPEHCFLYRRHQESLSSVLALNSRRFAEERRFFLETAERMAERGWMRAARTARKHRSSRFNALLMAALAVRHRRFDTVRPLVRHVLGVDLAKPGPV